jgi:hypothetical protein
MAIYCLKKRMLRYLFTVSMSVLSARALGQSADTSWTKWYFRGTISCSVTGQQNWHGNSEGAITLSGGADLKYRRKKGVHYAEHRFRGELGYLQPQNERWIKNNDLLRISMLWYKNPAPGWKRGFSSRLNTQWLSTWKINPENNRPYWYGGFMNPFTFDFSYDFTRPLLKNSRLLLSLATISVTGTPVKRYYGREEEVMIRTTNSYIRSRYGCSLQLILDESFRNKTILLDHQSNLVANSLSAEGIRLDIQNRISFKLFRYLQLRFDTRLLYDPSFSYKMQYRQEVLLGIFYDAGH